MALVNLILSDEQKYADDRRGLKEIFLHHESIGLMQVRQLAEEVTKLYRMAYGQIEITDYIKVEGDRDMASFTKDTVVDKVDLSFYPIVPNILQGILGDWDKKFIEYDAMDVNPESRNDVIRQLTESLQQGLIESVEQRFLAENQDVPEEDFRQKFDLLKRSKEYVTYYSTEFKSTLEQWANHVINIQEGQFGMKGHGRKILEQQVVTGRPYSHVNFTNGYYYPEVWSEENTFYLKSPDSECVSEGMMVGNFQYENISTILNKYGNVLTEDDLDKLHGWMDKYHNTDFVINDFKRNGDYNRVNESLQNYIAFSRMDANRFAPNETPGNSLIRKTTIYAFIPRKKYKITFRQGTTVYSDIVSEEYRVTYKPKYVRGAPKTVENLIEGEHSEVFWDNELCRCVKLDINRYASTNLVTENVDTGSIWIECGRMPIQFSDPIHTYGKIIPVFGGEEKRRTDWTPSIVKNAAPFQILYNWLWNRNKQLLSTEIGKFMMFNELVIPRRTLDGTWDTDDSLGKFMQVGKDTSLAPINTTLSNTGEPINQATGGIGQVIDLTKQQEILEKANLARVIKEECYQTAGLTMAYLYGTVQPDQSARTVAQGQQRNSTQIQHVFTRTNTIMERTLSCMLECAQYLVIQNPTVELVYGTSNAARTIFRSNTSGFALGKLGIFIKSNVADQSVMEEIRRYVATTNTLGADTLEMATMFTFKSLPELFTNLRELKANKLYEAQQQQERDANLQREQMQIQEKMQRDLMAHQANEKKLDREKDVLVAQLRALGGAEDPSTAIADQAIRLEELAMKRETLFENNRTRDIMNGLKIMGDKQARESLDNDRAMRERLELKKIELKEKDIESRDKRSKALAGN